MSAKKKSTFPVLHFPEKKEIFSLLDQYTLENTHLTVAVSGGPDSMLLSACVLDFLQSNGHDLSNFTVVHINHKTRPETDQEEQFIYEYFQGVPVVTYTYTWKKKNEETLRDVRRKFIEKQVAEQKDNRVLFTGHNLTDRIETTLMNISRGSGIKWIQNMKKIEIKELKKWSAKNNQYILLRPLLEISKDRITEICKKNKIPFVTDMSNMDSSISKRNFIRNSLFPQLISLGGKKSGESFVKSWQHLYNELDKEESKPFTEFYNLSSSVYRKWCKKFVKFTKPNSLIELISLLQFFNSSQFTSTAFLQNFYNFLTGGKQGHLKVDQTYFFVAHNQLYAITAKEEFWKSEVTKKWKIKETWTFDLGDFSREIKDKSFVGGEIRFPQEGDKWKSKRLKKRLINQKVPVFWRNFIPVIVKDGKVVDVYPFHQAKGYF